MIVLSESEAEEAEVNQSQGLGTGSVIGSSSRFRYVFLKMVSRELIIALL